MIQSSGALVKTVGLGGYKTTTIWSGNTQTWGYGPKFPKSLDQRNLLWKWGSYGAIYLRQPQVYAVINKIGGGVARLPLKVYLRDDLNRPEAADSPFAALLHNPWPRESPEMFWGSLARDIEIYGEAFLLKHRDPGGRPVRLQRIHPTRMKGEWLDNGRVRWTIEGDNVKVENIDQSDIVSFPLYHPSDSLRGLSPMEPLRQTLENDDAARRASSSFFQRGGRPGAILRHPKSVSQQAADRVKLDWERITSGADNFGATVFLEEGMEAQILQHTQEELQYIDTRKLNREEVCTVYDIPPPVVHILDHATFSNITEQMRSMYRDTMPPRLGRITGVLHAQIRDDIRLGASEPDFGDDVYAEFLLDDVLRGDFETRTAAKATAVQTGQLTIAEARKLENLPFIEGTDQLLVNSAMLPLENAGQVSIAEDANLKVASDLGTAVQRLGLGVTYGVLSADEARRFLPVEGPAPVPPGRPSPPTTLSVADSRTVMGRLSRPKALSDVDVPTLTSGLSEGTAAILGDLVAHAADVPDLRRAVKAATVS